ncbi:DUF5686 family protein [Ferruginibacter paludis]|uniref:DUF5686 family protein n=1 Tax=Ferruginibacter paludis TaxID=1310417 RepID=UPI0025B5EE84|nr:DUF5686 family protein [Ferruginibacter paludis]MDN3659154.1 DUF5686 family protein [Ferruginibacter paludis]
MKNFTKIIFLLVLVILASVTNIARAQTVIKGTIINSATHQPMPFVSVYFKGGKGISSAEDGSYKLSTINSKLTQVEFSYGGYKKIVKQVEAGKETVLDIEMEQPVMNAVVIKTKRGKYTNKDNPAVELIRKVIDNKDKNRISAYDFVQYQQYEKMELSLTNKPEKLMKNKLLKNYVFILDNQDTDKVAGKALVPVYLEETLSDKYFRKNPDKQKTFITGQKKVNFGEFVDNNGISSYINRLYADIDVYENNITILTNQFLSPVAGSAPTFYRFYIRDTVQEDGVQLVRLNFMPRNTSDLLFKGTLYVTLDGNYAVQKLNMSISKNANLNWTRGLRIKQDFERGVDGRYHLAMSNMLAEFAFSKNSDGGIMGERTVSFKNFVVNQPAADSIYKRRELDPGDERPAGTDSFWTTNRHQPLTAIEAKVYHNIDSLQNMKSYRRFMDIATLVLAGYKNFGGYEVGPVNAFYSFNPVEGFRIRAGGRTTPKFSNRIYLENYLAYGFKDQKTKYFLSTAYSLNKKSIYTFPMNYVKLSYQYDTKIPGQELQFVQEDNFLLSFKRGDNDKFLYNNIFKAEYVREFGKNISYTFGFKNWRQSPAGAITFDKTVNNELVTVKDITTTELSAELRWAPHEQFYQGKVYRIPIFNKYPIFKLRYIAGVKGLFNSEYNYHNLNLNIFKRVYFSQLGYADFSAEGGYIFGKLPYPLLTIHRANQTYAYQLNSFNLMNALEFISDHYASANMDYYFNGFILNKIPLVKKLKLREVASAKILYGGVRDENNPLTMQSYLDFPKNNTTGTATTYALNSKPYVEVSVGLANIFKLFRVDLVKRLTYLDNPGVSQWGIRSRVKFDF